MKKILSLSMFLLLVAVPASAAEFQFAHEKNDSSISIPSSETHKNLYTFGASVSVSGNTLGDLFAWGGMVTVGGNVEQDLAVFGGNLNLNGNVGGDLRTAGGNISINGPIGSDLLVGGGNVSISDKAVVAGDLLACGGNLTLDSEVKGKAQIFGGEVTINGKVDGDLFVRAGKQLVFGPNSEVVGKITYEGASPAVVRDGAKIGQIEFTKLPSTRGADKVFKGIFAVATLIKLLGLLIAGFVLFWLFPRKVETIVSSSHDKPLKSFGVGFLVLVVTPIIAVILCATVIGFYVGIIVMLSYLLLLILASVFMLFYVGNLILKWANKPMSIRWDLTIGAIAILIVSLIPVVGWIATGIVYLITLGSLILHLKQEHQM